MRKGLLSSEELLEGAEQFKKDYPDLWRAIEGYKEEKPADPLEKYKETLKELSLLRETKCPKFLTEE